MTDNYTPAVATAGDTDFNWRGAIDPDLQEAIALLGDDENRLRLASHPGLVHRAARQLLLVGDAAIDAAVAANPNVPAAWLPTPKKETLLTRLFPQKPSKPRGKGVRRG
ncbi:hypothetical protein [Leifsonia sp. Leaf264]|uniref:hypothetical protein n=1 Tax=Leifsonia sp. Leaf264 TaxID=1736314 RepID=UPI0006FE4A95|nr:hypothetical protein [Leifsonia sp. Leaf264]KQO98188.1 hypothetical protein ASF30_09005 [Leifsonia sp. Leaf264]